MGLRSTVRWPRIGDRPTIRIACSPSSFTHNSDSEHGAFFFTQWRIHGWSPIPLRSIFFMVFVRLCEVLNRPPLNAFQSNCFQLIQVIIFPRVFPSFCTRCILVSRDIFIKIIQLFLVVSPVLHSVPRCIFLRTLLFVTSCIPYMLHIIPVHSVLP